MNYIFDTFTNFLSGLGVPGRDKMTGTAFVTTTWTREQLEASYRGDWIARKAISIPAHDATREWRAWQAKQPQIEKLEETEKRLQIQLKLQQALTKARLYGGSCMLIGVEGSMEKELDPDTIKKDGLKFVHVFAPHQLSIEELVKDIEDPYYGQPTFYRLQDESKKFGDVKIHPSRMVRLLGLDSPDPMKNSGWGDPLMQMINDAVSAAGTVAQSVATLIQEAKLDVIKIPGLTEIFSTSNGTNRLIKRFTEANVAKSVINGIIMDAEEEWERIGVNFAGMPEILQMYLQIAAGAADIPMTRFAGMSPAGLNSTGESDLANYYDRITSDQELRLTPALDKLDKAIVRSALGRADENIFYEWNSLWQMTDAEKATIAKQKADTAMVDVNSGLIPPEALMKGRVNQLIEDGTYPGLEAAIEEALAAQEMLAEEEEQKLLMPPAKGGWMNENPGGDGEDEGMGSGPPKGPFAPKPKQKAGVARDSDVPFSIGDKTWSEELHPRGEDGKWIASGSSSGTVAKPEITQSAEFKAWFGNSKMVDKNGDPKVFYHATARDFTEFKPGGFDPTISGKAIWVTQDPKDIPAAHNIGSWSDPSGFREGARVIPVYVRMENPLMLDDKIMINWARTVFAGGSLDFPNLLPDKWLDEIKAEGYDGIVFEQKGHERKDDYSEFIVFEPNQLKSALGNRGTFDPEDKNILHGGTPRDDIQTYIAETTFYHGTRAPLFEQFSHAAQDDRPDGAFMFTPRHRVAQNYSTIEQGGSPRVVAVKLDLKNPKVVRPDDIGTYFKEDADGIKQQGYDGVVAYNSDGSIFEIGVFDAEQVRIINHDIKEPANADEVMTPAELKRFNELEENYKTLTPDENAEYKALGEKFEKRWEIESNKFAEKRQAERQAEEQAAHITSLKNQGAAIARTLGFDASRIDYVQGTRVFEVNGVKHTAAGDADIYNKEGNGRIRIYTDHVADAHAMAGVTAHEIEHFKFQYAMNEYDRDYAAMRADPGPAPDPDHKYWWGKKGGTDAMMKPDGALREPYDKKYPAYTAIHEARFSHPVHKFAEGDGVSKYSAEYWMAAHVGKATTDIAFHETLAEMAKMEFVNGKLPEHWGFSAIIRERNETRPPPAPDEFVPKQPNKREGTKLWRDLYRTVERMYKARK